MQRIDSKEQEYSRATHVYMHGEDVLSTNSTCANTTGHMTSLHPYASTLKRLDTDAA